MLIRIVKMTFKEECVNLFVSFFETRKNTIRAFDGCKHLELWQDAECKNVFFTYSVWENSDALLHYRSSLFFRDTWKQTKEYFDQKAEAWSLVQCAVVGQTNS